MARLRSAKRMMSLTVESPRHTPARAGRLVQTDMAVRPQVGAPARGASAQGASLISVCGT